MSNYFQYKGYTGSAEVDAEEGILFGRLLFIRDVIGYSGNSIAELKQAFEGAVDDYLKTCEELGDTPELPCKGSFNVRIGPELHMQAAMQARKKGVALNDIVCEAITTYLGAQQIRHVHHHHELTVHMKGEQTTHVVAAGQTPVWEDANVPTSH